MTRQEAEALAEKREKHKSPGLRAKRWQAVHTSVRGWHVALVDDLQEVARQSMIDARAAFQAGDLAALLEASQRNLMAKVWHELSQESQP